MDCSFPYHFFFLIIKGYTSTCFSMLLFKLAFEYDIKQNFNLVLGWNGWLDFYNKLKNAWFAHLHHQLPYYHSHKTKENMNLYHYGTPKNNLGMQFLKIKNQFSYLVFGNFVSFYLQTRIIFKPFLHGWFFPLWFHFSFLFFLFSFDYSIFHKTLLPNGKWKNPNKSMFCQML